MRFSFLFKSINLGILLLIAIDVVSILLVFASYKASNQTLIIISTFILLVVAYFTSNYIKRLIKGEEGEEKVRVELDKLPSDYYHMNDFGDGKRGNADLVVIGPTGIWTLEVKNYKAKEVIYKNGALCNENNVQITNNGLKQAYAESKAVEKTLFKSLGIAYMVNPVLVFANSNTKLKFGLNKIEGVYVIRFDWVTKLLLEQPNRLSLEQCKKIRDVLKKQTSVI